MSATDHAIELTRIAARAAWEKSGTDIAALDVSEKLAITDVFLVVSAGNERRVGAVVDAVDRALLAAGATRVRREGERENRWVLLDYEDLVVHVQHAEDRRLYSLERLWADCPRIDLQLPEAPVDAGQGEEAGE